MTKAERLAKSERARARRRTVRAVVADRTRRLYNKLRRMRKARNSG